MADSRSVSIHRTTTRDALGALRLPWCVDRRTRSQEIRISDETHRIPEALQLRVRNIEEEPVRVALRKQVTPNGEFSLNKIEAIASEAEFAAIDDSKAFLVGDELSLMEGCHRTCALYLVNPPTFTLETRIVDDCWLAYFASRLVAG
jgi:hypothetical protein